MAFTKIPTLLEWQTASRSLGTGATRTINPTLKSIDDVLDKYHKAFSAMAKRNVLTELYYALADWAAGKSGHFVPNLAMNPIRDLEAIVTSELGKNSIAPHLHKYERIVCLGLALKTGKMEVLKSMTRVEYQGYSKWYRTASSNDELDMRGRCDEMKKAIRLAHEKYQILNNSNFKLSITDDTKTLKLFMAPEFFFRGIHGAYDISKVAEILGHLRKETDQTKYKDWLFVFGTAIGASMSTETHCTVCNTPAAMRLDSNNKAAPVKGSAYYCSKDPTHKTEMVPLGAMIDNVALVQKGGENGDANTYLVTKEFISSIDFRRPGYMKGDVNDLYDKNKNKISYFGTDKTIELSGKNVKALPVSGSNQGGPPSKFTDERMGGNIFTIDSITFGMEICLDHLYNTLQQGGAHHIQVQLIPSAGMNIGHKDCVANGIVFNVDGARGDTDLQLNVGVNPQVAAAASYDFGASRTYFPDSGKVVIYPPQALPWPTDVRSFTGVVNHKPLPKPPVPRKPLPPIPPPKVNN